MLVSIWLLLLPLAIGVEQDVKPLNFVIKIKDEVLESIVQLKKTDELNLSNMNIRGIKQGAFQNISVVYINLNGNKLSSLPERIFSNLQNLKYLSVGQNEIKGMNKAFAGLENLKRLNLSYNPLDSLEESALYDVPKSSEILTSGNTLKSISTRVFEDSSSSMMMQDEARMSHLEDLDEDDVSYLRSKRRSVFGRASEKFPISVNINVCIKDGILTVVEIANEEQVLAEGCSRTSIKASESHVILKNLGIKAFQKGWYQLQGLPIVDIDLSNNQISNVTSEILNDLPASVSKVTLENNVITTIKNNVIINEHLKTLDLRTNLIESIGNNALERTKLAQLFLSRNKLTDINFVSTLPPTMAELIINRNQISRVPNGIFSRLSRIAYMNLAGNEITIIQNNAFQGLVNLRYLVLSSNKISRLEPGCLSSLQNLESLYLKENLISNCEKGAFAQAINLKDINLVNNKFSRITRDTFADAPRSLERLNLDANEISSLEENSFVGVPKSILYLSNNLISTISPGTFDIRNLQDLFLGGNRIGTISQDCYKGLPGLGRLWLSNNRISEIGKGSARHLGSLTSLDISKNPFQQLNNGALYGLPKDKPCSVLVENNQIQVIQGGLFDDA